MINRKEKEQIFYKHHIETFKKLNITNPLFSIKTAFFQKGKPGRHLQFFESELQKNEDFYIEFYDNVVDNTNTIVDFKPFYEDRPLFKLKQNPYYSEEYELKEGISNKGENYTLYVVSLSELSVILQNGEEITYSLYEKRKEELEKIKQNISNDLPKLQQTLTDTYFPNFDNEFIDLKKLASDDKNSEEITTESLANITLKDFAAIMLKTPVSDKKWLNEMINKYKQI